MPYITKKTQNGQELRLLIDTGTSKNFIKKLDFLKGVKPVEKHFNVKSINGTNKIRQKCDVNILGKTSTFFLLPALQTFDGIIGYDFLREINAQINSKNGVLIHKNGEEPIKHFSCQQTNNITIDKDSVPLKLQDKFKTMIERNINAFAEPNVRLPYNTNVQATIPTTTEEPIFSRSYPYPISASEFINEEIQNLLHDGIIRKSSSSYNSPVHVVSKKGLDEHGKQKLRMVIDFRKLNEKTTPDRYPIPDTSIILANLGKSKFFTTLDLKSGFHQIILQEKDRKKTAFNINNGKYEFCRLPFGLRNAPSIFQRAIDDVLRDDIGKFCHVYMDDIIIYSKDADVHLEHIEEIIKKLGDAGMRISMEKSKFFKTNVEFLGFMISPEGIKTCPSKVQDIHNFKTPETVRSLRSFLGLSGYYRRFIRDYALIAKPLTKYLRGENGHINAKSSRTKKVKLDEEALAAFEKLKKILASEDVLLQHPDYSKPFELTTDASSKALGAVLSQNGRPVTMISRTLNKTEENYATNERELLAIVWALQNLRHYLYGVQNIHIYTDHQPLIFSISNRNPNTKLKRWRAFIEEYSPQFHYKPGKENKVADALSRQFINNISTTENTIHSELSSTQVIKTIHYPINQFKNQLVITKSSHNHKSTKILFQKSVRHLITFNSKPKLLEYLKDSINPNVTNAIHCDLQTLAYIKETILRNFHSTKFIHTEKLVIDLTNKDDQMEVISTEHNRAHRSLKENFKQISTEYYFPKIREKLRTTIANCKICMENKYQRKPNKPEIGKTPVPNYPGEILHIDIFSTDKQHFLTCIDKFSKFANSIPIQSRSTVDIKYALIQALTNFKNVKTIVSDNEKSFSSNTIKVLLRDYFSAGQYLIPSMHSESNGQIEKFHATLLEIARCLKAQQLVTDTIDLILLATQKYNNTIHSVTNEKPIDILQNRAPNKINNIKTTLTNEQEKILKTLNKTKQTKTYNTGDIVFVKRNKRLGNKFQKLYEQKTIEKDMNTYVIIEGKKVHKCNLR